MGGRNAPDQFTRPGQISKAPFALASVTFEQTDFQIYSNYVNHGYSCNIYVSIHCMLKGTIQPICAKSAVKPSYSMTNILHVV